MNSSRQSASSTPARWRARTDVALRAVRRLALRLRRRWVATSLPFRRIDVRTRATAPDQVVLEAFAGNLRLARLVAVPARQLPPEDWVDRLPKDHLLPTYWICECFVDARFRQRGIGRRLVIRLAELAFARHADALIVGCANSPQSRQFSASLGFNVRGEAVYASLGGVADRLLV
jgi:GNAT superfamily N-acetyltransferase